MDKTKRKTGTIGFVFVHGAGLNGNVWERVKEELGYPALNADFPARAGDAETRKELSLQDYANAVRRQSERLEADRIVFVAHSLGGMVALQAAEGLGERLAGFVAVGAAIPKPGGSFLSTLPWPQRLFLSAMMRIMGTKPPESAIRAGLCHDLAPADADEIVCGIVPESYRVYVDRLDAALPDVPKLYVRLEKDKELGLALQNRMIRNLAPTQVRELETGHLPMLADPEGLRRILREFIAAVATG